MRVPPGADLRRRAGIEAGVKEHPGGRGHLRKPACRGYRYARAGIPPGRLAGKSLERRRRAIEDCNRNGAVNILPAFPIWDLAEVVATHQPDETDPWEAAP